MKATFFNEIQTKCWNNLVINKFNISFRKASCKWTRCWSPIIMVAQLNLGMNMKSMFNKKFTNSMVSGIRHIPVFSFKLSRLAQVLRILKRWILSFNFGLKVNKSNIWSKLWPFWCSLVCHFQGIAKFFFKSMWLAPNIWIVHNILPCITFWKNAIWWAWE